MLLGSASVQRMWRNRMEMETKVLAMAMAMVSGSVVKENINCHPVPMG